MFGIQSAVGTDLDPCAPPAIEDNLRTNGVDPSKFEVILGNLIENAIEYLKSVPDPDKRVIALSIRQEGEMDVIHTENYLDKTPKQFDDLPLTTKPDVEDHGFGLKSVRYTLKKYGGILRITTDDHLFSATAAMPRNK